MNRLFIIGAGGFVGAVARYLLAGLVQRGQGGTFPTGTLAVNVAGCFLIGASFWLVDSRQLLSPNARLFFMIGLLGSFTTFSTFGYETFVLIRERMVLLAALNAGAQFFFGLLAVWAGWLAMRALRM